MLEGDDGHIVHVRYQLDNKIMESSSARFGMVMFEGAGPGEVLLGCGAQNEREIVRMVVTAYNYAKMQGLEGDVREAIANAGYTNNIEAVDPTELGDE